MTAEASGLSHGEDGDEVLAPGELPPEESSFLKPFKAKADSDYQAKVVGGTLVRTRRHETLVNDFEKWLRGKKLETGRNAAMDLGVVQPEVIIEAKTIKTGWAGPIRQAVGQLYEYRYFQVASPKAALVFLADREVPREWIDYLENNRSIAVAYRAKSGFHLTNFCSTIMGL